MFMPYSLRYTEEECKKLQLIPTVCLWLVDQVQVQFIILSI